MHRPNTNKFNANMHALNAVNSKQDTNTCTHTHKCIIIIGKNNDNNVYSMCVCAHKRVWCSK